MDLDTALLRALVALADELHFGRAAARLGVSQQALSKRIARLESMVGTPVVDRADRRRLRLTPLGHEILPLARDVLTATDRLTARATVAPSVDSRLRVDTMGDYLAPHRWTHQAARVGGLPLDVVTRPPGTTADHLLATGAADVAFGRAGAVPRPWPPWLRCRLLLLEPLAVLTASTHPWAGREQLIAEELSEQRLWFPLAGAPLEWRTYLTELSEAYGVSVDTVGSTFGYRQWLEDVTQDDTRASLVGEAMTTPHTPTAIIPIVDPTPVYPWSLFWRESTSTETVQRLLTALGFPHPPPGLAPGTWVPSSDRHLG